jgi:hypothetical protein
MFIDRSYPAYDIAVAGLPLFASGFIFFAVNIVSIGYLTEELVENGKSVSTSQIGDRISSLILKNPYLY